MIEKYCACAPTPDISQMRFAYFEPVGQYDFSSLANSLLYTLYNSPYSPAIRHSHGSFVAISFRIDIVAGEEGPNFHPGSRAANLSLKLP